MFFQDFRIKTTKWFTLSWNLEFGIFTLNFPIGNHFPDISLTCNIVETIAVETKADAERIKQILSAE